ncbi:thioredoxin-like protein [Yarrowia lipolytica]|uniref:YALI0C03201p n=2 Tax=Yarrowia lipolytica TaxID=4952 RepID=Q6CD73_YARLI|nr:YALI0C03201p [Yarrowia lipolytica CLIB122]6GCS_f Chain f, NI8M SUBUNIT [Yarrowia lipolytica]6RFQ_f Chain f, Subunit NI8M of NADH:Ubiquinone Oxidoreductase (Complex I) [Yarrowia lipolytica]6RFR_f Chain f, Subunit NI8M of NADH:Ubiquinone Oxidoreductase (Complex I) [Yarrowia lipolytica]6RFS_f Chain f, Subunit NI8M of NADH:Ubiquinone Oxidoreductase (Complex I) [Yarrowia lipolytica]6Y79_f Chain f, Subunit NI8M of NADH:Ubiquinone Oxidoreductase (Complex I) [Yarrowia lipolytica]6YJ4_S Chain S, Su|eukprot:XP_501389.2 YALI0C03201p [Yarrowia lipolytica CLIB122]
MSAALREIRFHLCQNGSSSAPLRQFVKNQIGAFQKANPSTKVLVREANGVKPIVFARFDHGHESKIGLDVSSEKEVAERVKSLIEAK